MKNGCLSEGENKSRYYEKLITHYIIITNNEISLGICGLFFGQDKLFFFF